VLSLAAGTLSFSASHKYLDDDPSGTAFDSKTISVTVADGGTLSDSGNTTIRVNNLVPVVTSLSDPSAPIQIGGPASITANFTDVGTTDTHSCKFEWDDGTTSPPSLPAVVVTETNGSGSCTGTHTYATAGVYTAKVTVTDDDTGSAFTYYRYVVIYDPSAGFVTGGGWINSLPGAYTPNPTLNGKANFGFVSKYQKGAKIPTGETEFQFKAGDMNFHSISYDWLVVAGGKAQYKGLGTINGAMSPNGPYKFLLSATDGQLIAGGSPDLFKIKIWWESPTGTPYVVYDNTPGYSDDIDKVTMQALDGGSIVIHSGK
jgi:hypothetical protein